MKLKLLVAALGIAVSGFAIADSYQAEVSVSAARHDNDVTNQKTDIYEVNGVYHFNAVNTSNLPLAEAAYLGKNSNVFAGVLDRPRQDGRPSHESYQVGAEFYIPENFLYAKAGVVRNSEGGNHENDWFTAVGITPIEGLLLTTQYYHDAGYDANIHAKYVTDLGAGQFINVEAGFTDEDHGTSAYIGGDYYFDNTFSVGAEIGDSDADTEYTLRSRKFFTESISGDVFYTDADHGNVFGVGLAVRF